MKIILTFFSLQVFFYEFSSSAKNALQNFSKIKFHCIKHSFEARDNENRCEQLNLINEIFPFARQF